LILLVLSGPPAASAAPGDEWVFGADSPVALQRSYSQYRPAVSGDLVFWEDNRPGAGSQTFTRIFFRDLSDPDGAEQPLTPGAGYFVNLKKDQGDPAAGGTLVAWREAVPSQTGALAHEIRYIDFGDGCLGRGDCAVRRVPRMFATEPKPAVSGAVIIWQDEQAGVAEADILMYDTNTGEMSAVCAAPGRQQDPDVDGEWVAWVDNRGGELIRGQATRNDLYIRNMVTGEERRITSDEDDGLQEAPAVGGDYVVYSQNVGEATRSDIMVYRISTGENRALYAGAGFDQRPDIDGRMVVWEACPGGLNACGIWTHDLDTGVSQPVSDGPRGGAAGPVSSGFPVVSVGTGRIVWQDNRGGSRAIYQNRAGEQAHVLAERFRPELRLAAGEQFMPEPMELMLELPGSFLRKWPGGGFEPVRNPDIAQLLAGCGGDCYIDLMGSAVEAGGGEASCAVDRGLIARTYVDSYRAAEGRYPATVYARVKSAGNGAVIQYWINYPANDHPKLFHEGDWEMVQVRLDGTLTPYRADFSQHGSGQWRQWQDVEKAAGAGNPVVYVASGSHASYFRPGRFELVPFFAWDRADGGGEALDPVVQIIPEVEQAAGASGWLAFSGRWGEQTGASLCLPEVPGIFSPAGHRDGPPGPAFQGAKWDDPLGWLSDDECDGCEATAGEGAVLEVSAWAGADVHLYDREGNHLGRNAMGGIDQQIDGAYLLDYPSLGRLALQVPGVDATDEFRVEVVGASSGELTVTVPYHDAGLVVTLTYGPYASSEVSVARLFLSAERDFDLAVDHDGDGTPDSTVTPLVVSERHVDFLPPKKVSDLQAAATGPGAVELAFTAPGDAGGSGSTIAYDIRYSTTPITATSWHEAERARVMRPPLAAGEPESFTVDGLNAGTTYYFAVAAVDEAALTAEPSNVAIVATPSPELAWYQLGSRWGSYAEYRDRQLTVMYMMRNKGNATAVDARVEASQGVPDNCFAVSPMPIVVGDMEPDTGREVIIKYQVPHGAASFITNTYARCFDEAGGDHWYPEPPLKNRS